MMRKSKKAIGMVKLLIILAVVFLVLIPMLKGPIKGILDMLGMGGILEEEKESKLDPKDYSAEIEFEEGSWGVSNVWYRFRKGKWVWKCPNCGSEYINYFPLTNEGVEERLSTQLSTLTKSLIGQTLAQGAAIIQNEVNTDSNAKLRIHYTNGCVYESTTDKENPVTNLLDMIQDPNNPLRETDQTIGELDCPDE